MPNPVGLFLAAATVVLSGTCALADPLALSVAKAESGADAQTAQPVLTLSLTPDSAKAFADFTTANVGKVVAVRIDGEVVMSPRIVEPITGGVVQVSGSFVGPEVKSIADRIAKGAAKVEIEVVAE